MRPKIVVVGSSNTDMVVRTEHLSVHGETVLGEKFIMTATKLPDN
jgi:ribokinase